MRSIIGSFAFLLLLTPTVTQAKKMDTMPVDVELYRVHAPFEHVQYYVTGTLAAKKATIQAYFQAKDWEITVSTVLANTEVDHSRESHELISDMLSERLPLIRQRDLSGDNRVLKKWKRTQRWKDWSEVPQFTNRPRDGATMDCTVFRSPKITARAMGMTHELKDTIEVCFVSSGTSSIKVGVYPKTLHKFEGTFQVVTGQISVAFLPWLDGQRLAKEISELHSTLTNPSPGRAKTPPKAPKTNKVSSGTGFFVNQRAIVTNQHVVDGCDQVSVIGVGGASVIAEDKTTDLAVIFARNPTDSYLALASKNVSLGEDVSTFGYPLQQVLSPTIHMTKGSVSSLAGLSGNTSLFQMTAPIQPGNSGGPVINEAGEVVGVATSTLSPQFALRELGTLPQGVNFAVRASLVSNLLEIYGIAEGSNPVNLSENPGVAEAAVVQLECAL